MPQQTITIDIPGSPPDVGQFVPGYSAYTYSPINGILGPMGFNPHSSGSLSGYGKYGAWLRFQIPLSKIDRVDNAYFKLTGLANQNSNVLAQASIKIVAHNHDNSPGPDTSNPTNAFNDAISQSTTNATSASNTFNVGVIVPGQVYNMGQLKTIIAAIQARSGWAANQYITFYWASDVLSGDPYSHIINWYKAYNTVGPNGETSGGINPQLVITYTPGVGSPAYDRQVVSDLNITQVIDLHTKFKSVQSVLSITQDIDDTHSWTRSKEHTLNITQTVRYIQTYQKDVESLVVLIQTISGNLATTKTIESILNILQEIHGYGPMTKNVTHELTITQDISTGNVFNVSVEDIILLVQEITQNKNVREVEHVLRILQEIVPNPSLQTPQDGFSTLNITQDISYNTVRTRSVEHVLTISQSILGYSDYVTGPTGTSNPSGSNPVGADPGGGLGQGVAPSSDITRLYHPQAGGGTNFPSEPVVYSDTNPLTNQMTLQYPTTSPTLSIILPAPLFSNREELQLTRIQRKTRGGTLLTFSDDIWPKVRTFRYKFDSLSEAKIEEFFTFLSNTLGLMIRLTDYEGRIWDGFIVNPQGESAQFFRTCGKTTEFDFDGVAV